MTVLVTGATGFIGSHLAERLVKDGFDVTALVRKKSEREDRKECLDILKKLKVDIVYGDLTDKKSLEKAVKGKAAVFHMGAIARPMAIKKEGYFKHYSLNLDNLDSIRAMRKAVLGKDFEI